MCIRDRYCLLYCIAAFYEWKKYECPENPEQYENFINMNFDLTGMNFPTNLKDVSRFVKNNPHLKIQINIFCQFNGDIYPVKTSIRNKKNHNEKVESINILAVWFDRQNDCLSTSWNAHGHYMLIKNLDLFLKHPTASTGTKNDHHKKWLCLSCLNHFSSEESLKNHTKICVNAKEQVEEIPNQGEKVRFKNLDKRFQYPIVGFYDLETLLVPLGSTNCQKCGKIFCKCPHSFTVDISMHKPMIYSVCFVDVEGLVLWEEMKYCPDGDAERQLLNALMEKEEYFKEKLDRNIPLNPATIQDSDTCHYCEKLFTDEDYIVNDHCHYTGAFLGKVILHNC